MTNKLTFLLIEDTPMVILELKVLVEKYAKIFSLITIIGDKKSVNFKDYKYIDLVLIDVRLTSANSAELCRLIKSEFPNSFIIGMRNQGTYHMRKEMVDNGALGFIMKDCNAIEILAEIEKIIVSK